MRKMIILGVAAVMVMSACASAEEVDSVSPSGDDGTALTEETDLPLDSTVPTEGETPTESIPEDPNADVSSDAATSGTGEPLAEPGDTPPPADDMSPPSVGAEPVAPTNDVPVAAAGSVGDLAAFLGLPSDAIRFVSHQNVTWPDSSLGCPTKGINYTQVLTPGTLTILEASGVQYRYHSGSGSDAFLCMTPTDPVPPGSGSDT